jgi:hypothetical protein
MYSTWFSVCPLGYWDRNLRLGCASGLYFRGAESEECWEETPLDGVLNSPFASAAGSVSIRGGCGDFDGLECLDICDGEREEGNEEREVLRLPPLPLELIVPFVGGRNICELKDAILALCD